MGDKTAIQWTDATWNPVAGCSIVSPGCTNCYAMKQAHALERRFGSVKYSGLTRVVKGNPVWTGVVRVDERAMGQPLRWGKPRRIFVNSMSDLFHESLSDEDIDRVFAVMALAKQHTFQVLTKRAARMRDYVNGMWDRHTPDGNVHLEPATVLGECALRDGFLKPEGLMDALRTKWPLPNVWLGVSVEDQERADERIPALRATPAAVRFLSAEPLLGWVESLDLRRIGWVIVGGESGPGARPFSLEWAHSIRSQCERAGTAFFMKQLGANAYKELSCVHGVTYPTRDKKGGDISEFPEALRVREFPAAYV